MQVLRYAGLSLNGAEVIANQRAKAVYGKVHARAKRSSVVPMNGDVFRTESIDTTQGREVSRRKLDHGRLRWLHLEVSHECDPKM